MVLFFKKELLARVLRRRRDEARLNRAYDLPPAPSGPLRGPTISVVLPAHNTPPDLLRQAIASVFAQTYQDWQLCVADDASDPPLTVPGGARVRHTRLPMNAGIAACSNAALDMADGAYVAFLDHDDTLATGALSAMALAIAEHPDAGVFFSDEDQLAPGFANPYFKPGWNPELLLAQNLVCHLGVYRRTLLTALGGVAAGFEGSQDWELALRASAAAEVRHVPGVLYHWRQRRASYSATHAAGTREAGLRAVQAHLPPGATAVPHPTLPQWNRITYGLPAERPRVSLLLADGAALPGHDYAKIERVSSHAEASGDIVVFLHPGLCAVTPDWLGELVAHALRPEIGAVGARIDGPDGRVAQSGLILDAARITQTLVSRADAEDPGYRGHFVLARNVSAVSPHCFAIRRAVLDAFGLDTAFGDHAHTDLCLRLTDAGYRHVWTPYSCLAYTTMPREAPASAAMRARWGARLAADPYLNPYLTVRRGRLAQKPRKTSG